MIQRKPLLLLSTLIIFVIFFELVFADYYKTLGVPRGASEQQIKQAFKKLALKYHPDKNKDKDAKDKFIEISHGLFPSSFLLNNCSTVASIQHMMCYRTQRRNKFMTPMERKD